MYLALGNYQKALFDLDRALEIDPEAASALEYRGCVYYYYLNDDHWALLDFDKALGIYPRSRLAVEMRELVR